MWSPVVTLPLVPHHVQLKRRHRQLRKLAKEATNPSLVRATGEASDDDIDGHGLYDPLAPRYHRHGRRRSNRRLGGEENPIHARHVNPLYLGWGTHYVDLWIGTPPQRQTVIVDTGSSTTSFPCSGCNDCGSPQFHIDDYFAPERSVSFKNVSCGSCYHGRKCNDSGGCLIKANYQEGSSWRAYEGRDTCYMGGPHQASLLSNAYERDANGTLGCGADPLHAKNMAFDLVFGCQTNLTGLFRTQLADGILGMDNDDNSFWRQLYDSGRVGERKGFSLCYAQPRSATREGTLAGAISLGGYDARLHTSKMVWSTHANHAKSGYFEVQVRAMFLLSLGDDEANQNMTLTKVNASQSELNDGMVIVDSGTTDTYWNKLIAAAFREAFKKTGGSDDILSQNPVALTQKQLNALPAIVLQLEGDRELNAQVHPNPKKATSLAAVIDSDHPYDVLLVIPPTHYMEYSARKDEYVMRFYLSDEENSGNVIGGNGMMGRDIYFDPDNGRIGWAKSSCNYTKLVTENGYGEALSRRDATYGGQDIISDALLSNTTNISVPETFTGICEMFPCFDFAICSTLVFIAVALFCLLRRVTIRRRSFSDLKGKYELVTNQGIEITCYQSEHSPVDRNRQEIGVDSQG